MRFLAALTIFLFVCTFKTLADDMKLASPRGTFTIVQHYEGIWTSKLHFSKPGSADITLTDGYPWSASFYVSPDDQWILQVQKSGSGDNIS